MLLTKKEYLRISEETNKLENLKNSYKYTISENPEQIETYNEVKKEWKESVSHLINHERARIEKCKELGRFFDGYAKN